MGIDEDWTAREKLIARFISWGIIISVVLLMLGSGWTALEMFASPSDSDLGTWFITQGWQMQVLIVGGLIVGVLIGIFVFSIFIRKGQRFILNLLFKIEN